MSERPTSDVAAAERGVAVVARVRADEEDVLALGRALGGAVVGEPAGVEGLDVTVQLQIDPAGTGRDEQQEREGDRQCQPSTPNRLAPPGARGGPVSRGTALLVLVVIGALRRLTLVVQLRKVATVMCDVRRRKGR